MSQPIDTNTIQRIQHLNATMLGASPVKPPTTPQTPLSAVLADDKASWNFSKEGGTGAVMVKTKADPTGGVVIKVESGVSARSVEKGGQMMDTFFQKAQGVAPFSTARVTAYGKEAVEADANLVSDLKAKMTDLSGKAGDRARKVNDQIKDLDTVSQGKAKVMQMEFAQGTQITKMPLDDRLALYRTDAFPQTLARAMPTMVAMGMKDHLGMDVEKSSFASNASNLMFDTASGQLALIDITTGLKSHPSDVKDFDLIQFQNPGGEKVITALDTYLKDALKDQTSFDTAVDNLAVGKPSPLSAMMDVFTNPDMECYMFSDAEKAEVENTISTDDKRRFAANLIAGSVNGLDYMKANQQALKDTTLSLRETVKGVPLEHFHTDQGLNDFCQALEQVDTQGLKQLADLRMAGMAEQKKTEVATQLKGLYAQNETLRQDSERLKDKIQRMETKPTFAQRAQYLLHGKDNVIQPFKDQKQAVDDQAKVVKAEIAGIINQQGLNEEMRSQAENVGVPKASAGKLRDDPSMGSVVKQRESKKNAEQNDVFEVKTPKTATPSKSTSMG